MTKNISTTELLKIVSEEADDKSFKKIISRVVEEYPEISSHILDTLKLEQSFNVGSIEIITAKSLSQADKASIEKKLGRSGEYSYTYTVDQDILGGIVIKNGENITDNSLKSRLDGIFNKINS